jgi:hypothetical protein
LKVVGAAGDAAAGLEPGELFESLRKAWTPKPKEA